ncbi:major facilitator superfamily domain-containing protein [Kockovaella imperatae]|uniref:Major facilitator superfamily domain-containing protein n=1 Tax=Kockovaella imperatae TaxID=4999 RepID=A0A1Y1UQ39_9TREE|nr:major facilitator superfamily domain-containing protein [Kockovaella imperatae]ORX40178.1 major facilitator superfamily domain-containing protein [Kockovaella imperatae]
MSDQGGRHGKAGSIINRILPFTFAITLGPSVTASTALFIVRALMCRHVAYQQHDVPLPSPDAELCGNPVVGAWTASVMTGLAVLDGIVSFLSTSYVRNLADKYGRRPLLYTLPILAMIATSSLIVAYLVPNPILPWILLALNGIFITASTKSLFVPTLLVSDVADDEQRTRYFSRLEAVSLLGPGTGFILSALTSRYSSITLLPYYLALGFQFSASVYAFFCIPETKDMGDDADSDSGDQSQDHHHRHRDSGLPEAVEEVVEAVVDPIKPLGLLLPHRDRETGKFEWRLTLLTVALLCNTIGIVFIPTASLLYLSDKFGFQPEQNGWILAYLALSKFVFVLLLFPLIQKGGRKLYHAFLERRTRNVSTSTERSRLIQRQSYKKREASSEANHFDIILLFFSVGLDALALIMVSLANTPKQAIISYAFLALGSGDQPTFKSVFVSLVPEDMGGEALAALDMVWNAARLLSPLILGTIYAVVLEKGMPQVLFLVAGAFCAAAGAFIIPLVIIGRKQP